jgi:uncharacterized protein YndB with AHSA1/START domain
MSVKSVERDAENLTITVSAEFDAAIERVWDLFEDPRKLERWWGPSMYPATFIEHDLSVGGRMSYYMTGPDGDQPHGWWRILELEAPRRIVFQNGFADAAGEPDNTMPIMLLLVVLDESSNQTTKVTVTTTFPSREAMGQILSMGMEEGLTEAVSQMDALL